MEMEVDEDVWSNLHALEKLYGLLQIKPQNNFVSSKILDEKAKLVLKRLLDGATRQVFQSKILEEGSTSSSVSNDIKQEGDITVNLNQNLNTHQVISQSKKRCRNSARNNNKKMDSAKEKKNVIEKVPNQDHKINHDGGDCDLRLHLCNLEHEKVKEIDHTKEAMQKGSREVRRNQNVGEPGSMGSQANLLKPEPGHNLLDQNDERKKNPEKMVNVADAIWKFEARIRGDNQVPTRRLVAPVKERNEIGTNNQARTLNGFFDSKNGSTESNFVVSQNRNPVGIIEEGNELTMGSDQEDEKIQVKRTVNVAGAIQLFEARIRANQQVSTQRIVDSVKDRRPVGTTHQSSVMKNEAPQKNGPTESKFLSTQSSKPVGVLVEENELLPSYMVGQANQKPKNTIVPSQIMCPNCKKIKGTSLTDQMLNRSQNSKPVGVLAEDSDLLRRLMASQTDWKPKNVAVSSQTTCQNCKKIKVTTLTDQTLNRARNPYTNHLPNRKDQRMVSQMGKFVVERNEFPSHKPSQSSMPVSRRNNSPGQKNEFPRQMLTQTNTKNRTRRQRSGSRPPVPSRNVGPIVSKEDLIGPRRLREKDSPPQDNIILPTLLDHMPSGMKVGPNQESGTHKKNAELVPHKKLLPHQQGSERPTSVSSSTSYSYTSSTTQDTSSSSSCSESSGSELDSQPRGMLTHHRTRGPTSRSRSPLVGPMSSGGRSSSSSSSSEVEEEDHPRKKMTSHLSKVGPPHHVGPTTLSKLSNEKKVGRFRRLKDKLAIIFHHHHHHHYHHHHGGGDNNDDSDASDHNHRPNLKHVGNVIFHRRSTTDQAIKKDVRKSTVRNTPRQQQQGHFHTLIGGLFRHLWGSSNKKTKPSKADIKRLERTLTGKKATVKKWHWWQNFHRLSNSGKPRVKVGFKTKRPQLRGPFKVR